MSFLSIIIGFLIVALTVSFFTYFYIRRVYREQKNYERGLKMVPLMIHLPPLSEDTSTEGRDVRDVVDENISRAQVLYGILASTFQKGFKSKFYGQRHIAFEVVASKGFVHFYAAVPVVLLSVVEQAIVSAYPSARVEEVAEHNIFSPVGRISGTLGGELILKENFAYPIATYQDIKRDTMQALLNSLSTLNENDGAGVQILIRPAKSSWRKKATAIADKRREGKAKPKGFELVFWWISQMFTALTKPPEDKNSPKEGEKTQEISSLDQSIIQAIEDKTKHPGFEVLIRVISSSNVSQRAQNIMNNIVAVFSLFDAPGKNGFKFVLAKDIDSFVTAYILRFFPQIKAKNVLNSVEIATLFHFPDQENIPTTQLERQASKQVDGPRNISEEGLLLGYNVFRGAKKAIRLSHTDRQRHMYVVGQTGTGKSTFLENLALQDMLDGRGFAFVDPHGDTVDRLLAMVPKERTEDIIYFCPADMDYPMGVNMFEFDNPDEKDFLIQEAINMLYKLYDPQHQGIIGPRYEHLFRNAALTIMADPNGGTFVDMPKLFRDTRFVEQKLQHVTDQNVIEFWRKEMPQSQRSNEFGEVVSWFISKFGAFLSNEMMRNIIGQTKSSFNLREVMDNQKVLLVNLSRGRTGELNSKLLGMIFVMKFQAAAMSRADTPEEYRKDFCLYVDEFQNFSTDSFATILSEARKYRLNLIVANQFTTQLSEEIRDAVFGNVGSLVSFRVGASDAEFLAKQFSPTFDLDDLQRLPNANTVVRMLIGGVPTQAFSMATLPPLGTPNKQLAEALKQLSAAKYGQPKAAVEEQIFKRLGTQTVPPGGAAGPPLAAGSPGGLLDRYGLSGSPFGSPSPFGSNPLSPPPVAGPAKSTPASSKLSGSSFLDEWLAKRKNPGAAPARTFNSPKLASSPIEPFQAPPTSDAPKDKPQASEENLTKTSTSTTEPQPVKRTSGELNIRATKDNQSIDQEHTVLIDKQGNLKLGQ